jgi:hypothetical protein
MDKHDTLVPLATIKVDCTEVGKSAAAVQDEIRNLYYSYYQELASNVGIDSIIENMSKYLNNYYTIQRIYITEIY